MAGQRDFGSLGIRLNEVAVGGRRGQEALRSSSADPWVLDLAVWSQLVHRRTGVSWRFGLEV